MDDGLTPISSRYVEIVTSMDDGCALYKLVAGLSVKRYDRTYGDEVMNAMIECAERIEHILDREFTIKGDIDDDLNRLRNGGFLDS
jgi:hypothetical protein